MSDEGIEDRVRAAFADAEPSEETVARARQAAVAAVSGPGPPARARRRRPGLMAVAAAAAIVGAGAATAAVVLHRDERPAIPATPQARAGIAESGILAHAPWLFQAEGAPLIQTARRLPALRFAPGTTYRAALSALVRSVAADGTLPARAAIVGALPAGVVWASSRSGPRLDLTAPLGYTVPAGRIRVPSFSISGSVSPPEASRIVRALAAGTPLGAGAAAAVQVDAPNLDPCQRLPRARQCQLDPVPVRGARGSS